MIDLADAANFLRICETENLTRAASLAKVSPSTLSRSINRLENEMQVKLCRRDQKGIVLTEAGLRFREFASEALTSYTNLTEDLKTVARPVSGNLKMYCSVSASYIFIPRILSELRLNHPNLEISLETGDPACAFDLLRRNDRQEVMPEGSFPHKIRKSTDFVIAALPQEIPADISCIPLVTSPLLLIAPKNPLFKKEDIWDGHTYNLSKAPFIVAEQGQLRQDVEQWFRQRHQTLQIYSEVAGHEAIVSICALGFGLAIVPRIVADLSPFKNDVQILEADSLPDFRIGLCCLKSRAREKLIQAVRTVAQKVAPTFSSDLNRRHPAAP